MSGNGTGTASLPAHAAETRWSLRWPWPQGPRLAWVGRVAAILLLGGGLVLLAYLRAWPPFAIVMTDSMEPTMDVGSVVVLGSVRATPEVGDIIAVKVPGEIRSRLSYPPEIVHRVVEVTEDGSFRTRGDNRSDLDPFVVPPSAVRKEVVWILPGVGTILSFLFSPFGLLWLALGVLLFFVLPLYDFQKERMEVERVELAALGQLTRELPHIAAQLRQQGIDRELATVPLPRSGPPVRL